MVVQGYYCPRTGPATSHPKYTIPKEKGQDFLARVRKHSSKIPAPTKYQKHLSWETKTGKFRKNARLTMTDETIKWQKQQKIPSCANYDQSQKFYKVPMGKMDKEEGTDIISDVIYLSKSTKAAPGYY